MAGCESEMWGIWVRDEPDVCGRGIGFQVEEERAVTVAREAAPEIARLDRPALCARTQCAVLESALMVYPPFGSATSSEGIGPFGSMPREARIESADEAEGDGSAVGRPMTDRRRSERCMVDGRG